MKHLKALLTLSSLLTAMTFLPRVSEAIPRYAVRQGQSCRMCHVDPTGGGQRNDYGRSVYSLFQEPLAIPSPESGGALLDGKVSDTIALGSDVRLLYQHLSGPSPQQPKIDSFYVMEAGLYLSARLFQHITLYLAPTLYGQEGLFYEAFGMVHLPFADAYVKAGRFTPPYGLRLPNHSVFIRKQLGFNVRNKDVGIELGMNPGPLTVQIAAVNGITDRYQSDWDENASKALTARIALAFATAPVKMQLGVSGYYNIAGLDAESDPTGVDQRIQDLRAGVFGGVSIGRFTYLGEADYWSRDDRTANEPVGQFMSYQELAFFITHGLELVATYELWDDNTNVAGNAAHRVGGMLEIFPLPHLELNLMYRHIIADSRHVLARLREALVVAHFYF